MSGFIYNRALWPLTKRQIFEGRLGIRCMWEHCPKKRMTWREFKLAERKRRGPYWKYRNIQIMRRINFDKRRYGK